MTTFTPVRDAYQAWLRTADQLTFDGALEDSRRDGAAPAVSPSSANPAGILESIEVFGAGTTVLLAHGHPLGGGRPASATHNSNGDRRTTIPGSAAAAGGDCMS